MMRILPTRLKQTYWRLRDRLFQEPVAAPSRIAVIVAHPGDAEFGCAGSVAKWGREGAMVAYVIATNGDKGSGDRTMTSERLARIREEEQRKAAGILGVEPVLFLGYQDGDLEDSPALRRDLVRALRRLRPERVVTRNPFRTLNVITSHRDHRTIAGVVLDAVYPMARDHLYFPELLAEGLEPWKVREIYLMGHDEPDVWVDITETVDVKLKALACHQSQMKEWQSVEAGVWERAKAIGRPKGLALAEAFSRVTLPG